MGPLRSYRTSIYMELTARGCWVRACFQLRPDRPSPQSQSCRLPLPTFSIDQRLFTLETCCYGYDLRRQSTLVPRSFKGQPNAGRCSRCSALRSSRFQANLPLTKKRQLFPGLQPASGGSIASQLGPSRGGELQLQVREYWPDSLSTRGRTPARGRPAPPLRAELP